MTETKQAVPTTPWYFARTAYGHTIELWDVSSVTAHYVIASRRHSKHRSSPPRRVKKVTTYGTMFPTWEMAHAHLLANAVENEARSYRVAKDATTRREAVEKLTPWTTDEG